MRNSLITTVLVFAFCENFLLGQNQDAVDIDNFLSQKNWRSIIDSTWGEGLPIDAKLVIFDTVWTKVDREFACFQNLDVDWLALKNMYRPEIEDGVSRGRFAGIMSQLALALKESHTAFIDTVVSSKTKPEPGIPLLIAGGWGDNSHFGAGLTPLPDSSLLVYKAVSLHPLGLVPGDVVLGYEGIPWKELYKQLLEVGFPVSRFFEGTFGWGSGETSFTHSWLMSAGMNWHLFDTIDIVKYNTGDTLHLPTQVLAGQKMNIYCTEQLPVPGVPFPDIAREEYLTWNIIEGTKIGYVYVWSWRDGDPSQNFYNAIDSLMHVYTTDGIILDFRKNSGGYLHASASGLRLLFNSDVLPITFAYRDDPYDHFKMGTFINFSIGANQTTFYDKPIAVLTGPGAFSATDFNSLWMKEHPHARLFGKTTASAYASPVSVDLPDKEWRIRLSIYNSFISDSPDQFLTRRELEIDEPVWFTANDVYQGRDTVVEAAIDWIENNIVSVEEQITGLPADFELFQNYPNPFNPSTTITYTLPKETRVTLEIFNTLGQRVKLLIDENQLTGRYSAVWDGSNEMEQKVSSGCYVYRLKTGDKVLSKKMLLLK